jgi:cysteine desulfurase/selenocysteine lyase
MEKKPVLNEMPPYEGGGDMIKTVSFKGTTYNDLPFKFEAGTPNIAGCIALGTAVKYVQEIGIEKYQHIRNGIIKLRN